MNESSCDIDAFLSRIQECNYEDIILPADCEATNMGSAVIETLNR